MAVPDIHTKHRAPQRTAFSHAWSLCIEEQFYLILPPWCSSRGARASFHRSQGWTLITALLLVGIATRATLWVSYRDDGYYPHIYYATVCRFDEFLPGIALAMLKNFHRPTWQRITRHGQMWLFTGTVAVATMLYCVVHYRVDEHGHGYTFFMTAAGYSLNAMAFALPGGRCVESQLVVGPGPCSGGVQPCALVVLDLPVTQGRSDQSGAGVPVLQSATVRIACIIAVVSVLVGWLLYRLVESPFMALRDHWFPSNFAAEPAHQGDARAVRP